MNSWAMAHPYLTFFIILFGIASVSNITEKFLSLFARHEKRAEVIPEEDSEEKTEDRPSNKDMN